MSGLYQRYDYLACQSCTAVSQSTMPLLKQIASLYREDYCVFDEKTRTRKISACRKRMLNQHRGHSHSSARQNRSTLLKRRHPHAALIILGEMLDIGCCNGRHLTTACSMGGHMQEASLVKSGVRICLTGNPPCYHSNL